MAGCLGRQVSPSCPTGGGGEDAQAPKGSESTHVRRNAPEIFSAVRGCPRSCARTNPWFRGRILGAKCVQELPPGQHTQLFKMRRKVGKGFYSTAPDAPMGSEDLREPAEHAEICLHRVL